MYGKRKYRRLNREVTTPLPEGSVPTFVCPRCGKIKDISMPYTELSIIENGQALCYAKVCKECSDKLMEGMQK